MHSPDVNIVRVQPLHLGIDRGARRSIRPALADVEGERESWTEVGDY
jgi:hypothetical protein